MITYPAPVMATYKCKCCGQPFEARVVDRNRGWAQFCSKRCKAVDQSRRGRQNAPAQRARKPHRARPHHEDEQAAEAMARRMFGWAP